MGVCTEIGHLSHMMSRGRGCIIDEPKQHVSVSTHHTARRRRGAAGGGQRGLRTPQEEGMPGCRKVRQKSLLVLCGCYVSKGSETGDWVQSDQSPKCTFVVQVFPE